MVGECNINHTITKHEVPFRRETACSLKNFFVRRGGGRQVGLNFISFASCKFSYSSMSEEGKNRAIAIDFPNQPYYGTFQGVANYYPPPPPPHPQSQPQVVVLPQPIPPPGMYGGPQYYQQGYQTVPGTCRDFYWL